MLPSGPQRCGTAASFEAARVAFEAAWQEYLPRRSEADFQAWRDQAAWTAEKFLIGVNACEEDRPLASVGLPFPTSAPIFAAAKTTFRAMYSDARNQSSCRAGLLHEIKHDGYRLLVQREGKRVRLFTRNGHDWTDRYPLVVEAALRNRRSSFVIDGEAVLGADGISDFNGLHSRKHNDEVQLYRRNTRHGCHVRPPNPRQFRLPGVDFAGLVDRERKNIEALAEANRIAFEGCQRLVRRQAEILQETMKKVVADAGQEDAMKKRADLAKEGFETALANMRELAEMATKSQKDAFEVVRKRIEQNVEGIRNFGKKAGE